MSKRILILTNTLGMFDEKNGVAHTYNELLRHRDTSLEIDVVTYGKKDQVIKRKNLNIYVHKPRIPLQIDDSLWVDPVFASTATAELIASRKYYVVHSSTPCPLGWFGWNLARKQKIPLISGYHTSIDHYVRERVVKYLQRFSDKGSLFADHSGKITEKVVATYLDSYFSRSNLILAPSDFTKRYLHRKYHVASKVLSRGVDTTKFSPKNRTRKTRKIIALYAGRVAPEKGVDLLVPLFKSRKDVELHVVGTGPSLNELKKQLPNAVFSGKFLSGASLYEAYANADFLIFPSETDTFGNVVREAMASGLPVIVSSKMAPKEQVQQGKTGFICKNTEEYEHAIDLLTKDSILRKKMGKQAHKYAIQFTWKNIFEQLVEYYDECVAWKLKPPKF